MSQPLISLNDWVRLGRPALVRGKKVIPVDASGNTVLLGGELSAPSAKAQTVPRVVGKMNQTEARYAKERLEPRRLSGEVRRYDFEPVKLRLAGAGSN